MLLPPFLGSVIQNMLKSYLYLFNLKAETVTGCLKPSQNISRGKPSDLIDM